MYSYLTASNLLYRDQYGFWSGYSTELALIRILKIISDAREKKQSVIAVMMDLSNAFVTLDHEIPFNKLLAYGICDSPHSWLKSYLSNCTQRTKVNNTLSKTAPLVCGVP